MPKTATPRKPETVSRKLAETRNTSKNRSLSSLLGIGDNEKRLATDLGSGLNDVIGRGTIAGLLGLPGDLGGAAENGLRSLLGLPQVVPYGGSEHIGQKLEQAGLVSDVRRPKTELLASLISPAQAATAGYKAPQMARAGVQMMDNLASAPTMARIGQRGAVETNLGKMVAPQDEALRVAQANAAKPVSEGGLDLRPDNTPEERAAAMGFTRDYFHGTERLDRFVGGKGIDPKRATSGPMPYGTDSPELASNYAKNKMDTSRIAEDEGATKNYFTVSPKALGSRQRSPIPVEDTWYRLSPEQRQAITEQATRVGYSDLDTFDGDIMLHPEGVDATLSRNKWDWDMKNTYRGNALAALRDMWVDSGQIYREPELLSDIYQKAGYPYPVSQETAPWYKANGVFTGKAAINKPLDTTNFDEIKGIIPQLKAAFAKDRTRLKQHGADWWAKDVRYTPKQWVDELENDIQNGKNSFVWTSIPDKVTEQIKALGYDGIIDKSGKGTGEGITDVVIPFAPNQVRSRFAAFDPMRRDSSDLLAGLAPFGAVPWLRDEEP